jgi:hypothetical protein
MDKRFVQDGWIRDLFRKFFKENQVNSHMRLETVIA